MGPIVSHSSLLLFGSMEQLNSDIIGDIYNEKEYPKKPDDDPMDHEGHGTHVAGIIAADNDW